MKTAASGKNGKIYNKHLLTLMDYSQEEIRQVLDTALYLKELNKRGKNHHFLKGKTLAMIFAKSSTRTRVSFEQGIKQLGGSALFLSTNDIQLGRGETIEDTVKVLSRYNIDGIMIRTFSQDDLVQLARFGNMPIINGLTDEFHPCQALADLMTVYENFGKLEGLKMTYFGDGNNVAHSLMIAGAKMGMNVFICSPKGFEPNPKYVEYAKKFGKVTVTDNVQEAAEGANVLYTDVFFSMGQEKDKVKEATLMPYQVNADVMEKAAKQSIFLHCLPAHRGEEVTSDVIDGAHSVVFEQAENRLHAQKAIMYLLMR